MKSERTVLSTFQEGDIWRVRIEWPNGAVHYFGSFTEKDAIQWINAHAWLTMPVTRNNTGEPANADPPPSRDGDEQQTNGRT